MENKHNQVIPADVLQQAMNKPNEAHDLLRPYLHVLSNDERSSIVKMGDKSLALVEKTIELAEENPSMTPPYFNLADLKIDFADATQLLKLVTRTEQIARDIADTVMLAGHEAMEQSLSFYSSVRRAVQDKVPGAQRVFELLRERFVTGRRTKNKNSAN
ncbi:MAG: hypothetical protein LBR08_04780 [Bacteroidales bacterium]|jgi:hypothetical protein|nr:hypothetical protein [Bacteroidales bacterium]